MPFAGVLGRLLVSICALALLAVGAPPATSAAPQRTLVVEGVPNAYADVTFPTRFRLTTAYDREVPPVVESDGTYAGAYVTPLRGGPASGTFVVRGMRMLSDLPFPIGPETWQPPGRYRVHLLGDAPTTVRLRVDGLRRDVRVRTAKRSDVVASFLHRGVIGVATPVDRTVVPLTVRRSTLVVFASSHESTGFYGRRDMCVRMREPTPSPCLKGNSGRGWYWNALVGTGGLAGASAYHPGELPVGEAEVEFLDAAAAAPVEILGFTMTLN